MGSCCKPLSPPGVPSGSVVAREATWICGDESRWVTASPSCPGGHLQNWVPASTSGDLMTHPRAGFPPSLFPTPCPALLLPGITSKSAFSGSALGETGPGTRDRLLQCLQLDRRVLQQQDAKKLYGTRNNCTQAQSGKLRTVRFKKATDHLPLLRGWAHKQGRTAHDPYRAPPPPRVGRPAKPRLRPHPPICLHPHL